MQTPLPHGTDQCPHCRGNLSICDGPWAESHPVQIPHKCERCGTHFYVWGPDD